MDSTIIENTLPADSRFNKLLKRVMPGANPFWVCVLSSYTELEASWHWLRQQSLCQWSSETGGGFGVALSLRRMMGEGSLGVWNRNVFVELDNRRKIPPDGRIYLEGNGVEAHGSAANFLSKELRNKEFVTLSSSGSKNNTCFLTDEVKKMRISLRVRSWDSYAGTVWFDTWTKHIIHVQSWMIWKIF